MSASTTRLMLSVVVVAFAAAGCATTQCVDFEPPLVVGTQYGTPAGQSSGDLIFTSNGIPVHVREFTWTNGGTTFNEAYIDGPAQLGTGQSMRTNNINLSFDFTQLAFQPSQVTFRYYDAGGNENLTVNGGSLHVGELSAAPASIGGVTVAVATTPAPGGFNVIGSVNLTGAVERLTVGGQELWLDQVCATE